MYIYIYTYMMRLPSHRPPRVTGPPTSTFAPGRWATVELGTGTYDPPPCGVERPQVQSAGAAEWPIFNWKF